MVKAGFDHVNLVGQLKKDNRFPKFEITTLGSYDHVRESRSWLCLMGKPCPTLVEV